MYKLNLVKRRKKIRRAAIITTVGAIGVGTMGIVAFLGNRVGTFTVTLSGESVELGLSEHKSFEDQTSHLVCNKLAAFSGQFTVNYFIEEYSYEKLHSEETTSDIGKEVYSGTETMRFFKYTFYIKNTGTLAASYDMRIVLNSNSKPTNGSYPIDEYLRLAIFEGEGNYTPEYYARRSLTKKLNNEGNCPEAVCDSDVNSDNYYGEAIPFVSESELALLTKRKLAIDEVRMYTLLFWLEGYDPESHAIPDKGSLTIGANINAYPQSEANSK